jgi:hypothetical protein
VIECRVLLTTPAEIFTIDNTVFISRGLLNLVPNRSILRALLTREISQIGLKKGGTANGGMRSLLKETRYAGSGDELKSFLSGLEVYSRRMPHLTTPLFGPSLLEGTTLQGGTSQPSPARARASNAPTLELQGEYGIDSWESRIVRLGEDDPSARSLGDSPQRPGVDTHPSKEN